MRSIPVIGVLIGLLAFVVNPGLGCSTSDEYAFGEADMRALVEGTWRLTIKDPTGGMNSTTFTVMAGPQPSAQKGLTVVQQPLCGHRDFVRDAGACIAVSTLWLTGKVLTGAFAGSPVTGSYQVYGAEHRQGRMSLSFGGDKQTLEVQFNDKNELMPTTTSAGGSTTTLERVL